MTVPVPAPRKRRLILYVDGFNLYYRMLKGTTHKWLNLERMADQLFPNHDVIAIKYFTARVRARDALDTVHVRQDAYLRALSSLPRVEVIQGQFTVHTKRLPKADLNALPRTVEVLVTEEKGSDVNLASYLLRDAALGAADVVAVLSNDSDLVAPLLIASQDFKVQTAIVQVTAKLSGALARTNPNIRKRLRSGVLASSQFPLTVALPDGKSVTKPASWA